MNKKAKYNKIPFSEWKEEQIDWKNSLIGHKILCKWLLEEHRVLLWETVILDYEPVTDAFLTSENLDGKDFEKWVCGNYVEGYTSAILEEPSQDPDKSLTDLYDVFKKYAEDSRNIRPYKPAKPDPWPNDILDTPRKYPHYPKFDNCPHITEKPRGPFDIWCGITS